MDSLLRNGVISVALLTLLLACSTIEQVPAPISTVSPALLEHGRAMDRQAWLDLRRKLNLAPYLNRLDYLGAGQQVLIKVDPSKRTLSQTCVQVEAPDPPPPKQLAARRPAAQPTAVSTIRVMMMSTAQAREGFSRWPADYPTLSDIMEDHLIFANRQL